MCRELCFLAISFALLSLSRSVAGLCQTTKATSHWRGAATQQLSRHCPLTKGVLNKVRMCHMYNIIKPYYSLTKSSDSAWEHCILAWLIDPSIDCMLALQTTAWPEAIDQPLEKALEWSLPSLI